MSWSRPAATGGRERACRRLAPLLLLALCLTAAACGFRPLYGSDLAGASVAAEFADIQVAIIPDRTGQILRNYLVERFNPGGLPENPRYRLNVAVVEHQQSLGIRKDATATRANLIMNATFTLTDLDRNAVVLSRAIGTTTSYNLLLDQFATLVSERDARDRALRQISEDIRTILALYLEGGQAA